MKKLLLILLFAPLISMAQQYTEVVDVPGKTANQLYVSAKEWIALTFKSANNVIQMDDPTNGKIIGKGSTTVSEAYVMPGLVRIPCKLIFDVDFTVSIAQKDNKYKVEISDMIVNPSAETMGGQSKIPQKTYAEFVSQKEYFKNGSDPEWLINETKSKNGLKISNSTAKASSTVNSAYYNIICKTEDEMKLLLKSLELKMKKSEDNW